MEFTLANLMAARPLNILVADDELHVATSLALALRGAGHRIETATDGLQAFAILKENTLGIDLLIADNTMPGLTGSELIAKLQEIGFRGKYMVLSAYLSPELEKIYRGLGVDYIVHKPFDLGAMRLAVAEIAQAIEAERQ